MMPLDDALTLKIPPILYIGPEKLKRIRVLPLPPKEVIYHKFGEYHQWYGAGDCGQCKYARGFPDSYGAPMDCGFDLPSQIKPYSIRIFLIQLSFLEEFPCKFFTQVTDIDDYGNITWDEGCMESCGGCDFRDYIHKCHVAGGWIYGQETCPGWEFISKLCQSGNERRFLHQFLRVNHDRESPMPIPQAHIEITEHYRIDFVMFVPTPGFQWRWLAIEIDSQQYHQDKEKDQQKDAVIEKSGYEIIRLPAEMQMLDQVRTLYSKVNDIQEGSVITFSNSHSSQFPNNAL
jgi:hypothetical protein